MTSLRERLRRWIPGAPAAPGSAAWFSYRVFWTREVRGWDADRRQTLSAAVRRVTGSQGFVANELGRRYTVEGLDGTAHSGASLMALRQVLEAFEARGGQHG